MKQTSNAFTLCPDRGDKWDPEIIRLRGEGEGTGDEIESLSSF
jgi:hypothetical protein